VGVDTQPGRPVPVAVANQPYLQLDVSATVDLFDGPEVTALSREGYAGELPAAFKGPADRTLPTLTANASAAYRRLLDSLPTATSDGDAQTRTILRVTRTSPLQLSTASDGSLTAKGFPGSRSAGATARACRVPKDPRSHPVGTTPRSAPWTATSPPPTKHHPPS
jgi:hypothetical protein